MYFEKYFVFIEDVVYQLNWHIDRSNHFKMLYKNYIKSIYRRLYSSNNVILILMRECAIMFNSKLIRHWYNAYHNCSI